MNNTLENGFYVMAYDVPIKDLEYLKEYEYHPVHEEEYGLFDSLEKSLLFCENKSKELGHPLHLFYINEVYNDETIKGPMSYDEWIDL